jgi:hypothetical protein
MTFGITVQRFPQPFVVLLPGSAIYARPAVGAIRHPFYRSPGQALSAHGKSDEKTFGLPFPRDVSPKLACHGSANKQLAESFIANR